MKKFIATALCMLSFSAMASFNDVECSATTNGKEVYLEIESAFPPSSVFRRALLTVTENGADKESYYTVTSRYSRGFNSLSFSGAGLRLEIDTWPDSQPRWGRDYRATLNATETGAATISNVVCRFPNAF